MKTKLRKIVVNNFNFKWRVSKKLKRNATSTEWIACSRLLAFLEEDKNCKIIVFFEVLDNHLLGNPLMSGHLKVMKEGEIKLLNLNLPSIVSEILAYLLRKQVNFEEKKTHIFENGFEILKDLGYEIDLLKI